MRPIGFSTGALCRGDFRSALRILNQQTAYAPPNQVLELSALRLSELGPLCEALLSDSLPLSGYSYVSIHAPSRYPKEKEAEILTLLASLPGKLPIILHPDAVANLELFQALGSQVVVENMDLRKERGQTTLDLKAIFSLLPAAGFCFDLGHAYQVDPTLAEARRMLDTFADRLRQVHLSEVNQTSHHQPLSPQTARHFATLAPLIPDSVPIVLETPIPALPNDIEAELELARVALPKSP